MNDAQTRLLLRQLLQHLRGVIGRTIVDGDDLDIRVTLGQRGTDRLPGVAFLIETGNEDRN